MPKTYIGKLFFFISFAVITLAFLVGFSFLTFTFMVITPVLLYIFFRKNKPKNPTVVIPDGYVLAPCNGVVESVRLKVKHPVWGGSLQEISFVIPHFNESGLYLPIAGEVRDVLVQEGRSICRYQLFRAHGTSPTTVGKTYRSILIHVKGNAFKVGIHLVKCCFGFFPHPWLFPGDKGIAGANFGFFPLGGNVFIYLPPEMKVLVEVGQSVRGGETPVAVRTS